MDQQFIISRLPKITSNDNPVQTLVSWKALQDILSDYKQTQCNPCAADSGTKTKKGDKCKLRDQGAWNGIQLDGAGRKDENVISMSVMVVDIDHTSEEVIQDFDERFAKKFTWLAQTTHSHREHNACYRITIPMKTPVPAALIKQVRESVIAYTGLPADPVTKNEARFYFLPTVSVTQSAPKIYSSDESAPLLDWQLLLVDKQVLARIGLRKHLESMGGNSTKPLVVNALAGGEMAQEGERDATVNRIAFLIASKRRPEDTFEDIEVLFKSSLLNMRQDADWVAIFREKYHRACEKVDTDIKVRHEEAVIKASPYTADEMEDWKASDGKVHWMIQFTGAVWFNMGGKFSKAIPPIDHEVCAKKYLARSPVKMEKMTGRGNIVRMPFKDVALDWATRPEKVQGSICIDNSYYDPATDTFFEALAPVNKALKPVYDPEVHTWLGLLGKHDKESFFDWLALFPDLTRPLAALYLQGEKSSGKSLLQDGLAMYWMHGAYTEFNSMFGAKANNFTSGMIENCPLIVADEGLPKGQGIGEYIRTTISSRSFTLERKYCPPVSVQGCVRMIMSANNNKLLLNNMGNMDSRDVDAIRIRFLYLIVDTEPQMYIESLKTKHGSKHIDAWKVHKIAEHMLWLRETRKVNNTYRFGIKGATQNFSDDLQLNGSTLGHVLEAVIKSLTDKKHTKDTQLVRVVDYEVYVNPVYLTKKETWERYLPHANPQSTSFIIQRLHQIATDDSDRPIKKSGTSWQPDAKGIMRQVEIEDGELDDFVHIRKELLFSYSSKYKLGNLDKLHKLLDHPEGI